MGNDISKKRIEEKIPSRVVKYKIKPYLDTCDVITKNGERCGRSFMYSIMKGNTKYHKDCTKYCLNHCEKYVDYLLDNRPYNIVQINDNKANLEIDLVELNFISRDKESIIEIHSDGYTYLRYLRSKDKNKLIWDSKVITDSNVTKSTLCELFKDPNLKYVAIEIYLEGKTKNKELRKLKFYKDYTLKFDKEWMGKIWTYRGEKFIKTIYSSV